MSKKKETIESIEPPALGWWAEVHLAAAFLTRLPFFSAESAGHGALAPAMKFFPIVGTFVGFLGGAVFWISSLVGLPIMASSLLALVVLAWVTGALHEDGLSDVTDGFGGGFDREAKLEIMKDSHAGAFGVMAVVFAIGLRLSALMAIGDPLAVLMALMATGALSRAAMPLAMQLMDPARQDGLAVSGGQPNEGVALVALGLAAAVLLLTHGLSLTLSLLALAAVVILLLSRLAKTQIGGYTGDVLGAVGVLVETAALLALAVMP